MNEQFDPTIEPPPEKMGYQDCGYQLNELVERLARKHGGVELACDGRAFWLLNQETAGRTWRDFENERPRMMLLLGDGRFLKAYISASRESGLSGDGQAWLYYTSGKRTLIDYGGIV